MRRHPAERAWGLSTDRPEGTRGITRAGGRLFGLAPAHPALRWLLILLPVWLGGCAAGWTALNRGTLEADIREVLEGSLDEPRLTDCRMIGSTRSGYCILDLDLDRALAIAEGLRLESGTVNLDEPDAILPVAAEGEVGCLAAGPLGPVDGRPAFWIGGRPGRLALHGGGQLEYLVLVLSESSGQACVQVSYAYG